MAPPENPPSHDQARGIVRGAMIACEDGDVAVEAVKIGDIANTLSDGPQVVRWVGCGMLATAAVRFQAGALGGNRPARDLLVAPSQRMVISGWQAEVLFGEARVLVSAEALLNGSTITLADLQKETEIFHILFDKHETINANGAVSESFYPNKFALNSLSSVARAALDKQVPELSGLDPVHPFALVHSPISIAEAALLR